MELFVNFCEDTIFEMQLLSQISEMTRPTGQTERRREEGRLFVRVGSGGGGEEEEEKSWSVPLHLMACASAKKSVANFLKRATLKNLRKQYRKVKKMTFKELVKLLFSFFWSVVRGALPLALHYSGRDRSGPLQAQCSEGDS